MLEFVRQRHEGIVIFHLFTRPLCPFPLCHFLCAPYFFLRWWWPARYKENTTEQEKHIFRPTWESLQQFSVCPRFPLSGRKKKRNGKERNRLDDCEPSGRSLMPLLGFGAFWPISAQQEPKPTAAARTGDAFTHDHFLEGRPINKHYASSAHTHCAHQKAPYARK